MFSHGSLNAQSGQGSQAPRPPPFLQHPSTLPALSHNFQQGPLLPSPEVPPHLHQPGFPMYQHSPLAPHFAARQVLPCGMLNTGQPYLRPPPTVHGGATLSHMYSTAQEKLQHAPYMAFGPPPQLPPGSHNAEMLQAPIPPRSLPPTPSQGSLYRAPLPQQPAGVQGLHQIPPPVPPPPASNFSHSARCGSPLEPMGGTSQISSMAPAPPPPPPPPLPPSSSPQPIPPRSPPPVSCSATVSMPLPAGHLFLESGSSSEINNLGDAGLSSNRIMMSVNPSPPPKPKEEIIIRKIEELCQLIAKNGSSYEDMVRQKEFENPEFNFLFGGEPGSQAAIAHDYFLWMKRQYILTCNLDGIVPAVPTNHLAVATELNASADSDMEMEDDITGSEMDQAVNQPVEGREQTTDSISNGFDAKEQLHALSRSTTADATTVVLSDKELLSGPSSMGEQGSKLVSIPDDEKSGRSGFGNQGPIIISYGDTEFPLPSYKENSSKPVAGDGSLSMEEAAAECITSDKYSQEAMKGSSPFRLLQEYASNDSSENDEDPCLEDANPGTVSQLVAGGGDNLHRELNLKIDSECKSPCMTEKRIGLLPESGVPCSAPEFFSDSQREAKMTAPTSIASGSASEQIDTKYKNQSSVDYTASPKALLKEDAPGYEKDIENKRARLPSNAQKIDKFGRLVREGDSDSDSDDSTHAQRCHKKGRSRSRSRSPLRRRRKRRNPQRRRAKRSRSRSWSPRNRRSRSRSPSFRHAGDFSSGNMRQDKGQMRECFDFLRGKCYRGAFCRYMHHGSEKSEGSRYHRSRQQYIQLPPSSKNYNTHDDKLSRKASFCDQETMIQDVQHNHDISVIHATKDDATFHNRGDSVSITLVDSENLREGAVELPETKVVQEKYLDDIRCVHGNFHEAMDSDLVAVNSFPSKIVSDAIICKSHGEACKDVHPSLTDSVIQQSQLILSDPVLENIVHPVQETDDSSVSDSSPNQTSETSTKKLHDSLDSVHNSSHLPPFPTSDSNKESNNAPQMTELKRDHNLIPPTTFFQSHSAPLESFPSYMLPNQSSLFTVLPPVSLPPPPPLVQPHVPILNVRTPQTGVDLQFQQGGLPPRSDFESHMFRPYSTELANNSQVGDFRHQAYPALRELHQPLLHAEGGLKPLPGSNPSDSNFGGMGLLGEDCVKQLTVPGLSASVAFAWNRNYPHPGSLQESPAGKVQSFPVDSVPPREIPSSSQIHPYLQQKQPPYDLHHSVHNSVYGIPGKISSSSRYPADLQDGNQRLLLPDFGLTRSSTHFNPYASTFEKPLSSRFSSDFFKPEKDTTYSNKHEPPSSLSLVSVDEPGVGSKQSISSPLSARGIGRVILRSGNDQYDPLFDSIEPSSNSYKKSDHVKKWETPGNSDVTLRLKGSNQPLDVEENNMTKEVGGITVATSPDNEEFGETADAEVGDVENGSQSNADALGNTDMGEIEIDQIKSPGKSKKSKESRSMKLFKACLAEFVKEVLKPSWRQGNMSKETFKTVVKKTVDKVSGAMKSHHIPKSKVKINQYIDSSQRKLTKLVMGYVDKYAKG